MPDRSLRMKIASLVLSAGLLLLGCTPSVAELPSHEVAPAGRTVLVELFTSQGCSSCPPADNLLRELAQDPALAGRIVPLAFHVDYWNHLGWSDPFSSSSWSQRQREYASALSQGEVYTPEAVVGGSTGLVGSNEAGLRRAILDSLGHEPPATISVDATSEPSHHVRVSTHIDVSGATGAPLDVMLAISESGLSTRVGRGENGGRTLESDFVVRRLEELSSLRDPSGNHDVSRLVTIDKSWNPAKLRFVVFLQEPKSRWIFGAATASLSVK